MGVYCDFFHKIEEEEWKEVSCRVTGQKRAQKEDVP